MVGLCGAAGGCETAAGRLAGDIAYNGDERIRTVTDEATGVGLASVTHPPTPGDGQHVAPVGRGQHVGSAADGAVTVLLWGDVWGDERDGTYHRIETPAATYCAERYVADGTSFLDEVNGNFAGVVFDRDRRDLLLFTDRMGTRPIHWYRASDGLVFSTSIQSLPLHPAVDTGFDEALLAEYFALKRSFGTTTPLTGVEIVHPATVLRYDLDDGSTTTHRYWEPRYAPTDADPTERARELADTMRTIVADRLAATTHAAAGSRVAVDADDAGDADTSVGLLLSGGSDSRLVLAAFDALDHPVRAYHLNEWRNREARIAERAAAAVGAEFTLLERDDDYQARAAATASRLSDFVGYFNQHHAGGFADRLRDECDVLFTGHYGDMLFKGNHLRTPTVDLGPVGSFDLPTERPIADRDAFVADRVAAAPAYLDIDRSIHEIYDERVRVTDDGRVEDHGVSYRSFREATLASRHPLTNGTSQFFYHATAQMLPGGTPFLDNRLVDLFLTIPIEQLTRGDLINRAIAELAPALADLPHGRRLLPIRYPFALNWASELLFDFANRHLRGGAARTHWSRGPWTDHASLIRDHSFVSDTIDANEALIRGLPFLDWDAVNRCYDEHRAGNDRVKALYTLVTFLNMPIVERLVAPGDAAAAASRDVAAASPSAVSSYGADESSDDAPASESDDPDVGRFGRGRGRGAGT